MIHALKHGSLKQKGSIIQTPKEIEIEIFDHLSVPTILLHGKTPEERKKDLYFSVVIRAYMCHEISMMKAGEFLGCKSYNSVCKLFKTHNIPTIKQAPDDIEKESEHNRNKLEQQLDV